MDGDADRDPEPPAHIEQRRAEKAELDRQYRERKRELEKHHGGIPETHDDLHNEADYEVPPLWEIVNNTAWRIARLRMDEDSPTGGPDADVFDPLAATIGDIRLMPYYWSLGDSADLTRKLDGQEATRVYLYMDLSPLSEYRVVDRLNMAHVRDALDIEDSVSQSTLNRMPGRMEKKRRYYLASETETLVR